MADINNVLGEIGQAVADLAKMNLTEEGRVDTGMLRDSIHWWLEGDDTVVIGTNLEYAPYIELGTGLFATNGDGRKTPWRYQDSNGNWHTTEGMSPTPYLQPALDTAKPLIKDLLKSYFTEEGFYGEHRFTTRF